MAENFMKPDEVQLKWAKEVMDDFAQSKDKVLKEPNEDGKSGEDLIKELCSNHFVKPELRNAISYAIQRARYSGASEGLYFALTGGRGIVVKTLEDDRNLRKIIEIGGTLPEGISLPREIDLAEPVKKPWSDLEG